jgi:hypothetical protein
MFSSCCQICYHQHKVSGVHSKQMTSPKVSSKAQSSKTKSYFPNFPIQVEIEEKLLKNPNEQKC